MAIYIGYFGAGVGILVLSLLALLGMEDIHAMNGLKTLLVSVVNGVALLTFIIAKIIVWPQAILMLIGAPDRRLRRRLLRPENEPPAGPLGSNRSRRSHVAYFFIRY